MRALALIRQHAPGLLTHAEGWAEHWRQNLRPGENLPNVLAMDGSSDAALWDLLSWAGKVPLPERPAFTEDEDFWRRVASLLYRVRVESEHRWPDTLVHWDAIFSDLPPGAFHSAPDPLHDPGWIGDFAAEAGCLRILLCVGLPVHAEIENQARRWRDQIPRQHQNLPLLEDTRELPPEKLERLLSDSATNAAPLRVWQFVLLHLREAHKTERFSPAQILDGLKAAHGSSVLPDVLADAFLAKPDLHALREFLEASPFPLWDPAALCGGPHLRIASPCHAKHAEAEASLSTRLGLPGPSIVREDANGRQVVFVDGGLEPLFSAWLRDTNRPEPLSLAAFRLEIPCLWTLESGQSAIARRNPLGVRGPPVACALETTSLYDLHAYCVGVRLGWLPDPRPPPPQPLRTMPLDEKRLLLAAAHALDLDFWNYSPVLAVWIAELGDPAFRPADGECLHEWAENTCEGILLHEHPRFVGLICAWGRRISDTQGFPMYIVHRFFHNLAKHHPTFVLPPEMRPYEWLIDERLSRDEQKRRHRYFRTYLSEFAEPGHLAEGLKLRIRARALALRIRHNLPCRGDEHKALVQPWIPRFHPRADLLHDLVQLDGAKVGTLLNALDSFGEGSCDFLAWLEIREEIRKFLRDKPSPMSERHVRLFLTFVRSMDPLEDLPNCLFEDLPASAPIPPPIAKALDAALRGPPNFWTESPILPDTATCPFETISEISLRKKWDRHIAKLEKGTHLRVCRSNGVRYVLTDPLVMQGITGRLNWWLPLRHQPETLAREPWNLDISPGHIVDVIREIPGQRPRSIALALTPGRFAELRQWQFERAIPRELL